MSNIEAIESALIKGDLSKFTEDQRVQYYMSVCNSLGLNHLTKPFDYITLNGKLVLYAKRDATDQLRRMYNVSIEIVGRETVGEMHIVTAKASLPSGRTDEATGVIPISNLKGSDLANAYLKCETKAKRRVTLSVCGLGIFDETEVETIKTEEKAKAVKDIVMAPKQIEATPQEYKIPFGNYAGQALKEIPKDELLRWAKGLEFRAANEKKEIQGQVKEAILKIYEHCAEEPA